MWYKQGVGDKYESNYLSQTKIKMWIINGNSKIFVSNDWEKRIEVEMKSLEKMF